MIEAFPTGLVMSKHFRETSTGREILMLEVEKVRTIGRVVGVTQFCATSTEQRPHVVALLFASINYHLVSTGDLFVVDGRLHSHSNGNSVQCRVTGQAQKTY